jgi:hypothetical protein
MRFAHWVSKATGTNSEFVIIDTFARQQWFRERASILRLYIPYISVASLGELAMHYVANIEHVDVLLFCALTDQLMLG